MSNRIVTLVNIGNTNTQYAIAEAGVLQEIRYCRTADLQPDLLPEGIRPAVASVVPAALQRLTALDPFVVNCEGPSPVRWNRVDVSTLGADRVANAIQLASSYALPAVCIDCGTAITFEAVDADSSFSGGAILPGRMLLRRSLHDYTAQLPLLEMFDDIPAESGRYTAEAMRLGVDGGAVGMVKELMRIMSGQFSQPVSFVAVGGDCNFFIKHIEGLIPGGADFTLRGILAAWEMNNNES